MSQSAALTQPLWCPWQERGYVTKEGRSLRPESRGRVLASFLQHYFPQYVDYGFTASVEDQLDHVSGASSHQAGQSVMSPQERPFTPRSLHTFRQLQCTSATS